MLKNINSHFYILTILTFASFSVFGQHQEVNEKPEMWKGEKISAKDTTTLQNAFKRGQTQGHFRYFFSHTDNNSGLSDYFANAAGGGLRYESGNYKGFRFGVSGFYIYNIGSSDFTKRDPLTNQPNRYEIGLFDVENPENKNDMARLEEFYVKYSFRKSYFKFGKQLINTPFINLQDGRMRPTSVEGFWMEMNELKNIKIHTGWIYAVSPRSTVNWYPVSKSVGVYPSGVNSDGLKSNYFNNIKSSGVALIGLEYSKNKTLSFKTWNMLFENVNRSHMVQTEFKHFLKNKELLFGGIMYLNQVTINNGGNENQNESYTDTSPSSNVISSQLGYKWSKIEISANHTHIFSTGRYLMPREWGRDPFYTFMPRERNEGFGNLNAYVAKFSYITPVSNLKLNLAYGYFKLPDVKNFRLNKYGQPSYSQINIDIKYSFSGLLKGMDAQVLLVNKKGYGNLYNDRKFEINKVNMMLYNVVLNYHF
jgi:hypothetical protein